MISPAELPIVSFLNDTGQAQLSPVFEHVSNYAPTQFDNLKHSDDIPRIQVALDRVEKCHQMTLLPVTWIPGSTGYFG